MILPLEALQDLSWAYRTGIGKWKVDRMRACAFPHHQDRQIWELGGTWEDTSGGDDSALGGVGLPALDKMFELQCRDRDFDDGGSCVQTRYSAWTTSFLDPQLMFASVYTIAVPLR